MLWETDTEKEKMRRIHDHVSAPKRDLPGKFHTSVILRPRSNFRSFYFLRTHQIDKKKSFYSKQVTQNRIIRHQNTYSTPKK